MKKSEILKIAKKRYSYAQEKWDDAFDNYREWTEFADGQQWENKQLQARREDQRPSLVFNRLAGHINNLVGSQRQNRTSINVLPIGGDDSETANLRTGLIRNIEVASDASDAYDTAYKNILTGGLGAFRVNVEYSDDETFDQDIEIESIKNPLTVLIDPDHIKCGGGDSEWLFIQGSMSKDEFDEEYPEVDEEDLEHDNYFYDSSIEDSDDEEDDLVKISEYFYKEYKERTILLMSDGSVVNADELEVNEHLQAAYDTSGVTVKAERLVKEPTVIKCLVTSDRIVEKKDLKCRHIPVIFIYGETTWLDGVRKIKSLVPRAMDPQRLFNYLRSQEAEALALAPKSPWVVTAEMIEGHEQEWTDQGVKNRAVLTVNTTDDGMPVRQMPAQIQSGYEAAASNMVEEIKASTGQFDASLGARSNEVSGKAILARQRQGATSVFEFLDNLNKGIQQAGRIIVDLIPRVYSYERSLRVYNDDDTHQTVTVNEERQDDSGEIIKFNDLTSGRYDVLVKAGPSYETQRMEAADSMMGFVQAVPSAANAIGGLIAKNMDWPGATQISARLEAMVPPEIAGAGKEGDSETPEVKSLKNSIQQMKAEIDQLQKNADTTGFNQKMQERKAETAEYEAETKRLSVGSNIEEFKGILVNTLSDTAKAVQLEQMSEMKKDILEAMQEQMQAQQPEGQQMMEGQPGMMQEDPNMMQQDPNMMQEQSITE